MPGELYAFEGPDGVGKSTLAKLLSEHLNRESIPHELLSFPGNEPHTVSELIYRLYHAPQSFGIDSITPLSLQVMVTAAHIEVIESRIKPTLQSGKTVILDRFWWSTWVYASLVGVEDRIRNAMIDLEKLVWGSVRPRGVFLIWKELPFQEEHSDTDRKKLLSLYKQIVALEKSQYEIHQVPNDGLPSDALKLILKICTGAE